MEQPSSTEEQSAMAPVYGNMTNLCLICGNAQNPEGQPFIDIHGKLGTQLKILDKIHKFLAITIEAGFPPQVCVSCVGKLNVCHEIVQLSENAHEKFKSLREEWEAKQSTDVNDEHLDDTWSPMDVDVSSPEADVPVETQELKTDQQPDSDRKTKSATKVSSNQITRKYLRLLLEETSTLKQTSLLGRGSQIVFTVAEPDDEITRMRLSLVLINVNKESVNNKEIITEKVKRISEDLRKRFTSKPTQYNMSNEFLHSCQSCKCSFFLQEEMVSHFESLHPEEVHQCTVCEEKICGPVQEKHMELHRALEGDQLDSLLTSLESDPSNSSIATFDPEFVLVPLGSIIRKCFTKQEKSEFLFAVQRSKFIKPDMKLQILLSLRYFMSKFRFSKPRNECEECGKYFRKLTDLKSHIKAQHNPKERKCCHCQKKFKKEYFQAHIEKSHGGGEVLICKPCDERYRETGQEQPHMVTESIYKFKCPVCHKIYETKESFDEHMHNAHNYRYLCELCDKCFNSRHVLEEHLKLVHLQDKDSMYVCKICGTKYSKYYSFHNHMRYAHEPKICCNICGKLYNRKVMYNHMKKVHQKTYLPCKYCGKILPRGDSLNAHERNHEFGTLPPCTICKQRFVTISSMKEHMLRHERGEEIVPQPRCGPRTCPICSRQLASYNSFYAHMKRHKGPNGIKPILRSFTLKNRSHPCYPCLARFTTAEGYEKHVETCHSGIIPTDRTKPLGVNFMYQCQYCDKKFHKIGSCVDHEAVHRGEKNYSCDFCGKQFWYMCDKFTHQKKCSAKITAEEIIIEVMPEDLNDL